MHSFFSVHSDLGVFGYRCHSALAGSWRLRGEWQHWPFQLCSSPGPRGWRQLAPMVKITLLQLLSRGEWQGSMLLQVIRFQRLSSECSHYFWPNYLRPHINKQPARVKAILCSELQALFLTKHVSDVCCIKSSIWHRWSRRQSQLSWRSEDFY